MPSSFTRSIYRSSKIYVDSADPVDWCSALKRATAAKISLWLAWSPNCFSWYSNRIPVDPGPMTNSPKPENHSALFQRCINVTTFTTTVSTKLEDNRLQWSLSAPAYHTTPRHTPQKIARRRRCNSSHKYHQNKCRNTEPVAATASINGSVTSCNVHLKPTD